MSKISLIIFYSFFTYAQSVPENLNSNIYDFLDRMDVKNLISTSLEAKPFAQKDIKKYLIQLKSVTNKLSIVELKTLNKYLEYYNIEGNGNTFKYQRKTENITLNIVPIAGYSFEFLSKLKGHSRVGGVKVFTTYNDLFNLHLLMQDRGEFGEFVDDKKDLSPQRGYAFVSAPNGGIEYSDVIAGLTFDWNWLRLSLAKDYNRWGTGIFGQLILSDKVNAFPHVKLEYLPADWLRFRYIFGWLNSQVLDSSSYYHSNPGSRMDEKRYDFINKFISANFLTFQPFDYLVLSIGNSFVYSGKSIRLESLIPLSFFKYLDRDVGKGSVADGNGQMFFDFSFNYFSNLRMYGSLFIDVISIRKTIKGDYSENWFGYTIGTKVIDPLIQNVDLTFEYTKIDPWVYEHKDVTTTYKHLNYQLGHWIGQNADLLSFRLKSYLPYNLCFVFDIQYFRKGGLDDIYYVYVGRDEKKLDFLYSPLRKDLSFGMEITYEPITSLILSLNHRYSDISDEDKYRTPKSLIGKKNHIKIGFQLGFPY
jgi:hypothetical protein